MNAVLAIADPGDEFIFPVPYYFNHEMAVVMAGCRAGAACRPTANYQLDLDAIRARDHAEDARGRHRVAEQSDGRRLSGAGAARGERALPRRAASFTFTTRRTSTSRTTARRTSRRDRSTARRRTRSRCTRSRRRYGMASWRIGYMVIPESLWDAVNKIQDTLLICAPAVSQHVGAGGRSASAPAYARAHLPRLDAMRQLILAALSDAGRAVRRRRPSKGAFYYFVRVAHDARSDDAHRAADPRASHRRHSRLGVRRDRRLLSARVLRRARRAARSQRRHRRGWCGDSRRRHDVASVRRTSMKIDHLERQRHSRAAGAAAGTARAPSSRTSSVSRRSRRRPSRCPSCSSSPDGYWCYWHGGGGYSGVALLVRRSLLAGRPAFSHPPFDHENAHRRRRHRGRCASRRCTCRTAARTTRRSCGSSRRSPRGRLKHRPPGPAASDLWRPERGARGARRASEGAQAESDRHASRGARAAGAARWTPAWSTSAARSIRTTTSCSPGGRRGAICASATSAGASTTCWPAPRARPAAAVVRVDARIRHERSRAGRASVRLECHVRVRRRTSHEAAHPPHRRVPAAVGGPAGRRDVLLVQEQRATRSQDDGAHEADLLAGELSQRMQLVTAQLSEKVEQLMNIPQAAGRRSCASLRLSRLRRRRPCRLKRSRRKFNGRVADALGEAAIFFNNVELPDLWTFGPGGPSASGGAGRQGSRKFPGGPGSSRVGHARRRGGRRRRVRR